MYTLAIHVIYIQRGVGSARRHRHITGEWTPYFAPLHLRVQRGLAKQKAKKMTRESIYRHIAYFQRWLKTDSTSFKELREKVSFKILTNAKKTAEDIQQYHTQINTIVNDNFIDTYWQTNPEECMKKVCDIVGLDILPEKLIQWRPVAGRWIKNNENIKDWYEIGINKITTAIVENKEMALPELDIMGQIIIMAHLMRDHGKRLILPTDDFPLDAQILHGYLK